MPYTMFYQDNLQTSGKIQSEHDDEDDDDDDEWHHYDNTFLVYVLHDYGLFFFLLLVFFISVNKNTDTYTGYTSSIIVSTWGRYCVWIVVNNIDNQLNRPN